MAVVAELDFFSNDARRMIILQWKITYDVVSFYALYMIRIQQW